MTSSNRLPVAVARRTPAPNRMSTGTVLAVLPPTTAEDFTETGWQVQLDLGGGLITNAGIASTYNPQPGDKVAVTSYRGSMFVTSAIAAGATGEAPGDVVASVAPTTFGFYATTGTTAVELPVTELAVSFTAKAGCAYEIEWQTGYRNTTVAATFAYLRIRRDSLTGLLMCGEARYPITTTDVYKANAKWFVVNPNDTDSVINLFPTVTGVAGSAVALHNSLVHHAFIEVRRRGPASRMKYGFTIPPETV
jgi:hypothetical protein